MNYEARVRRARVLTIGVSFLVVLASLLARVGGSREPASPVASEQASMGDRFAQSRLLLHQRAGYLKEQWNEVFHPVNKEQSFAEFVESNIKNRTSP